MINQSSENNSLATKTCLRFLGMSLFLILLDQWTKFEIVQRFEYGERLPVTEFFDLYYLRNFGAAFSFLSDAGGWQKGFFVGLSTLVSLGIIIWLFRFAKKDQKILITAMSLVLAGAIGNVIDRINYGYVVDFISFHFEIMGQIPILKYMFPNGRFAAFNVADIAISCGAVLLLIDWWLEVKKEKKAKLIADKMSETS